MSGKLSVLFLCTGNSCRSQMAEGLYRALRGDLVDCASAGIETPGLNPLAAEAASEEEALPHYRRVRDEIRVFVEGLPENLNQ